MAGKEWRNNSGNSEGVEDCDSSDMIKQKDNWIIEGVMNKSSLKQSAWESNEWQMRDGRIGTCLSPYSEP